MRSISDFENPVDLTGKFSVEAINMCEDDLAVVETSDENGDTTNFVISVALAKTVKIGDLVSVVMLSDGKTVVDTETSGYDGSATLLPSRVLP